jgi:DNA-binding CsgD family transcriptional regulator
MVWSGAGMRLGLGTALGRLGDPERARPMLEGALASGADLDMPRVHAGTLSALARISDDPGEAERLEHEALDLRWRFGINVEVPESLEALAKLAAEQGSEDEAARLLAAATAAREAMGCPLPPVDRPVFDELASRLESLPAWNEGAVLTLEDAVVYATKRRGPRKRPASGWASLTPIERQVVDLVAEGLTNPQIGERLFISKRTVQAHLARIFPKLGVSSRSELAAEAARSGVS